MSVRNPLLRFTDEHPRLVIAGLLAVIAAGGFGGGLWVNSLKSNLQILKSNLQNQRIIVHSQTQVINENAKRFSALNEHIPLLHQKLELLRRELPRTLDGVYEVQAQLEQFKSDTEIEEGKLTALHNSITALRKNLDNLDSKSESIMTALDKIGELQGFLQIIDYDFPYTELSQPPGTS